MGMGMQEETDLEGGDGPIMSEINITPLTDIFLVLVIILIMSSVTAIKNVKQEQEQEKVDSQSSGLKINLPSGEAREIDPGSKSLVVSIQKDGVLLVNDKPVPNGDLDRIFVAAFTRDKNTQIVLRADTGVSHGVVVGIMERAKRVGLSRLAIATSGG